MAAAVSGPQMEVSGCNISAIFKLSESDFEFSILTFPLFLFTIIYGPIVMSPETVENVAELRILLFIFTLLAFFIYIIKPKMGKTSAILLLLIYVAFTVYILGRSVDSDTTLEISKWLQSISAYIDTLRFWK